MAPLGGGDPLLAFRLASVSCVALALATTITMSMTTAPDAAAKAFRKLLQPQHRLLFAVFLEKRPVSDI